jgi:hypothetical protein
MYLGDENITNAQKQALVRQIKKTLRKRLDDMFRKIEIQVFGKKVVNEFHCKNEGSVHSSTGSVASRDSHGDVDYNEDGEDDDDNESNGEQQNKKKDKKRDRDDFLPVSADELDFGHYGTINSSMEICL